MQVKVIVNDEEIYATFLRKDDIFLYLRRSKDKKVLAVIKDTIEKSYEKLKDGSYKEIFIK